MRAPPRPVQLSLWTLILPAVPAGELLRQARGTRRVSQRRLADGLGVDQATVSRLERGQLTLTIDDVVAAADVLAVSPTTLLGATAIHVTRNRRPIRTGRDALSRVIARAINTKQEVEFVMAGGSLRALRWARDGRQPLTAGQAAIVLAVLGPAGETMFRRVGTRRGAAPPRMIESTMAKSVRTSQSSLE